MEYTHASGLLSHHVTVRTPAIMLHTLEQLEIAAMIDARVLELLSDGCADLTILAEMAEWMPGFKRLLDIEHTNPGGLEELCQRLAGLFHYAEILETLSTDMASGSIQTEDNDE